MILSDAVREKEDLLSLEGDTPVRATSLLTLPYNLLQPTYTGRRIDKIENNFDIIKSETSKAAWYDLVENTKNPVTPLCWIHMYICPACEYDTYLFSGQTIIGFRVC